MTKKGVSLEFSSKQKLFRGYVELIQPILGLTNSEAAVFAQLLYLNNEKKDIPEIDRFDLIFSTKYRKDISIDLGIKEQVLQNCFSKLRKKNLIIDNTLPKYHQIFIEDDGLELILKLKLK